MLFASRIDSILRVGCTVLILLFPVVAEAQVGIITGHVNDAKTGSPLPGANVVLVEIIAGAATDLDGRYLIADTPIGTYTARVSFVGYRTIEQQVEVSVDTLRLDVRLEPDYARHDEIVVTGIASERSKATADVAVSRIDTKELFENNNYRDVSQLAFGKVAGLTVQPSSGNVAGGVRFILRTFTGLSGNHQPVIYLDGVRIDGERSPGINVGGQPVSMLAQLNPSDIERIDVLKGPAGAAMYGTSGSNGVVLITTSKGAFGAPVTANYRFTIGENSQAKPYDAFTASTPDAANAIFRSGEIGEHLLEIQGGSEAVRFFTSYAHRSEQGHIPINSQNRHTFRANVEAASSTKFRLSASTFFLRGDVFRPHNDNPDDFFGRGGFLANVILRPTPYFYTDSVAVLDQIDVQEHLRFIGSFDARYSPVQNLTIHGSVGYDGTEVRNDNFGSSGFRFAGIPGGHRVSMTTLSDQLTYNLDARSTYRMGDGVRGSTALGLQAFDATRTGFSVGVLKFSSTLITSLQSADLLNNAGSFDAQARELGIFATQDFTYRDQVFVTLGLRRDFASAIGSDAPSITYPRASLAFRIDNVVDLSHLDFLKIRGAYGEAGQLPRLLDGLPLVWTISSSPAGPGAEIFSVGNPGIQPERIGELEFGIEAGLFNNRLSFDGTYYRQSTTNSIAQISNPPSSGLTPREGVPRNIGSAKGWGIETSLSATPVYARDYSLDMTLLWQWQHNEVTSLGGGIENPGIVEGLPIGAYLGWTSRATFDQEGRYVGAEVLGDDRDGDGRIDRTFLGIPYPDQNGSFQLSFRFLRNFRFTALADWQLGLKLLNEDDQIRARLGTNARRNIALVQIGEVEDPCEVHLCTGQGVLRPDFEDFDVSAQPVGSDAYRAAAEVVAATETIVSDYGTRGNFVDDADFLKLREVSLRYDFTDLIRKSSLGRFVRTASFVLAGRNLFTATSFDGPDPEASSDGAYPLIRLTSSTLPHPRTVYVMISLGF